MKRRVIAAAVLAVALTGIVVHLAPGCTSFAVYSDRTLYGANFDYPPNAIRFSIEEHDTGAVFLGAFRNGATYALTTGLNAQGIFAANQMVFPDQAAVGTRAADELFFWEAFDGGVFECANVSEVLDWIGERQLVQVPEPQLHNLYADTTGNAMVLESSGSGNVITPIDGDFLVMTNFYVKDFVGTPLDEIIGSGASRYRVAHRYISKNFEAFDIDHAFEVLRNVAMTEGSFLTRYSLVADPAALEIYIALERDFEHIWRVSLEDRTISTYRGFDEEHALPLGRAGITGTQLQRYAVASASPEEATSAPEPAAEETEAKVAEGEEGAVRWPILSLAIGGLLALTLAMVLLFP